jgi:GTPase
MSQTAHLLACTTVSPHDVLTLTGTSFLSVHCGSIRQTASILSMSQECLRTGDKALVHFRFIKHPEYIKAGQRMVTQYYGKLQ